MKTLHDTISEIDPDLIPLFAHPEGDVSWLHDWQEDSPVGRDIKQYLHNVQVVAADTLDADALSIWEIAADQCLTWAFG